MRTILAFALAALLPAAAGAQLRDPERRPSLGSGADTNDANAYYQRGMDLIQRFPGQAADAFYWAGRLNPAPAESQYARGVALWRVRAGLLGDQLKGLRLREREQAEVRYMDSLLYSALQRNPLVNQQVTAWMYESLPGEWSKSWETRARLAYTNGRFADAVRMYARALESRRDRIRVHYDRALAFLAMERPDSALAELTGLLDEMRRQDVKQLVSLYESKAMFEYAVGSVLVKMKRYDEAREAFGRALAEDLSLGVVHGALGDVARVLGDTAAALREYEQGIELSPRDALIRFRYGALLLGAGRPADAEAQYRALIETEPYWALAYLNLGLAYEHQRNAAGAAQAYEDFLKRAPRTGFEQQVAYVTRKLAALKR